MRRELQRSIFEPKLLQHLPGMPVSEDAVSAEVAVDFYEVRLRRRRLPCPRNSRLGVAYNAVLNLHVSGANPRRQGQNDRRRITSRIRQQGGAFDRLGVQLGQSVHRSLVEKRSEE